MNLVALASALALALAFGPAQAAVLKVPADFATIQDAASSGDTVSLKKNCGTEPFCSFNGIYHQSVDIDKKLTLNLNGAILDGAVPLGKNGTTDGGATTVTGPARLGDDGINIDSDGDGTTIVNCTIRNFDGDGISEDGDADYVTIRNNTLINNEGHGLDFNGGDDYLVERNTAIENDGDVFNFSDSSNDGIIRRNVAIGNHDDGFNVFVSDGIEILNNRAFRNSNRGFDVDGDDGGFIIMGNRAEVSQLGRPKCSVRGRGRAAPPSAFPPLPLAPSKRLYPLV